jgi:hypothetical protein
MGALDDALPLTRNPTSNQTSKNMKTTYTQTPSAAHVERLGRVLAQSDARAAAFFVLRGAATRATGMALSLDDLPDLPCVMNAADEIEELFKHDGATAASLATARELANDAVRELLAEEGFDAEEFA